MTAPCQTDCRHTAWCNYLGPPGEACSAYEPVEDQPPAPCNPPTSARCLRCGIADWKHNARGRSSGLTCPAFVAPGTVTAQAPVRGVACADVPSPSTFSVTFTQAPEPEPHSCTCPAPTVRSHECPEHGAPIPFVQPLHYWRPP